MPLKSSIEEIRERFDREVDRFSDITLGQDTVVDSLFSMEMVAECAQRVSPYAIDVLDLGCGAGNYTIKCLEKLPNSSVTLVDISDNMLVKARERIAPLTKGEVTTIKSDIRDLRFPDDSFDIAVSGFCFHHLRNDDDWEKVFTVLYNAIRPTGGLIIADLVTQDNDMLSEYAWENYAKYLEGIGGKAFCMKTLANIAREDSPRSITYQLNLLRRVGFVNVDIIYKNLCFGIFCGTK